MNEATRWTLWMLVVTLLGGFMGWLYTSITVAACFCLGISAILWAYFRWIRGTLQLLLEEEFDVAICRKQQLTNALARIAGNMAWPPVAYILSAHFLGIGAAISVTAMVAAFTAFNITHIIRWFKYFTRQPING